MARLRIGFLGAGAMTHVHGTNLNKLRGVEIKALCATSVASAASRSEDLTGGKAAAYDDFDRMLREVPLDILYVSIPPGAHCGQVEKAARKGIHLFLEKPIAIEPRRAASMVRAIEKAGIVAQVGYMSRCGHAVRKLKAKIEDGSAGRPTLFQGRYFCNSPHKDWWRDVTLSGGQVLEQAIHTYDLAIHFLGEPQVATGFAANLCHRDMKDYTVEDTSVSAVRFKSGALATVTASNCAIPGSWTGDCRVVCENLTVLFDSPNEAEFIDTRGGKARRRRIARDVNVLAEESRRFVAAVRGKGQPIATAREGLMGVKLTSAVLASAAQGGKPVRIR